MKYICCIMLAIMLCGYTQAQHVSAVMAEDSTYNMIKELKEVVVSAEKRELTLTEIPIAISVINNNNIPYENNLDLRNLSGIVPNFYMQESGLKLSTPIYVRGIGTVSGTPPVGLYVDGVPIFDKNAFLFDLYDIKQIEVLRGPQTTLYGRNSIIGLINITTKKPINKFSLQAQAGIGSYNSQNYSLIANLPATEWFLNKIAFTYNSSDGYFKNLYTGKKSNNSDSYDIRYTANIYPSGSITMGMGLNYNHSFDDGYAYHAVDSLKHKPYWVHFNDTSSYKRDLLSSYINISNEFSQTRLNSVTSYSWSKDKQNLDADFTFYDVYSNNKKSRQNLVTQELNFQSKNRNTVNWTIGTFGFYKDLTNDYVASFGKDRQLMLPMPITEVIYYNNTTTWGVAGYGQIDINELLPDFTFTLGLRYDFEKTSIDYRDSTSMMGMDILHELDEKKNFDNWLPKFSILKTWNNNFSSYMSISKGYKAGGYNIISNDLRSEEVDLSYGKETLWNFEIGTKYFSINNKFNINGSVFYIDWKDQQIFVMETMGPRIKNAGDTRSYGFELDMSYEFVKGLTYFLSGGYSNSKYYHHDEYKKNRTVMAPDFTVNTGLTYYQKLNNSFLKDFVVNTSTTGIGRQFFDEANRLKQNPYFLWNMNVTLSSKHVDFNIWGKNILNKSFFCYMLNSPVGNSLPEYKNMAQSGAPSRFGASIIIKI